MNTVLMYAAAAGPYGYEDVGFLRLKNHVMLRKSELKPIVKALTEARELAKSQASWPLMSRLDDALVALGQPRPPQPDDGLPRDVIKAGSPPGELL